MHTKFQSEKRTGNHHFGGVGINGTIMLKWILKKLSVCIGTRCMWLRIESIGGYCEHGNERLSSIKGGEFLD
jgi:hypothetical protein